MFTTRADSRVQWILSILERYHEENMNIFPNFLSLKIKRKFDNNQIRYYKKDKFKAANFLDLKITINVC